MKKEVTTNEIMDYLREHMVTKADLDQRLHYYASKDDLDRFATKEDLNRFATKEDLNDFATKDDLNRFATKEDLNDFATREEMLEMFPTRDEMWNTFLTKQDGKCFATKDDMRNFKDEILSALDGIAKRFDKFESELVALHHKYFRHEERLEVIEQKIGLPV